MEHVRDFLVTVGYTSLLFTFFTFTFLQHCATAK